MSDNNTSNNTISPNDPAQTPITDIWNWLKSVGAQSGINSNTISNWGGEEQAKQQNFMQNQQQGANIMQGQGLTPTLSQNQVNPVTGWTDKHAQLMQKLVDKAQTIQAQQALDQHGIDATQKTIDVHNATLPTANKTTSSNNSTISSVPSSQPNTSTPTSDNPINNSISNVLGINTTPPQTIPVSNPAGPSSQKTGNFEYDRPNNLFEQIVGRPQVYQDASGVVHYKPGGLFGSSANQEALTQAKELLGLSSKEPLQPKDLVDLGVKKAAMAFDINQNSNEAAKGYRNEYQKLADDSGWTQTVKDTQLASGIPINTTNPLKQQQLVEAATGTKLGDLLKDPNALQGLKGNLGNQAEGLIKKLSQGKSALTPQQMARLKDVVNQQYQTKKTQFALATQGMANQILSDNKRRINGAQIDPKDALRPIDVVGGKQTQQKQPTIPEQRPAGATHYSPSTGKFYNVQGQEL